MDSRQPSIFGDLPTRLICDVPGCQPSLSDDRAIGQTLDAMTRIVNRTAHDPHVTAARDAALAELPPDACAREKAAAIHRYIRQRVRFVQDEQIVPGAREVLIEPPRLLTMPQPEGDCDDFTMAVCALCSAAAIPSRVIAVAADPDDRDRFTHVYAEAQLENGSFFALDASHGSYAGWSAPDVYRRLPWALISPRGSDSSGAAAWPCWLAIAAIGAVACGLLRKIF